MLDFGPYLECNGKLLREMIAAVTLHLEKAVPQIDALNVFPVPDGDTGTNMLLTLRTIWDSSLPDSDHAGEVLEAIASGILMGARGNSGVILAQIWRGLAQVLSEKATFTPKDLALAFKQAADLAYKGVSRPVEGTMLTVIREVAEVSNKNDFPDLVKLMEAVVACARETVGKTPLLLPVLAQAGVVDAGGQGLYTLLEGALLYLKGEKPEIIPEIIQPSALPEKIELTPVEEAYGYCTEFVLLKSKLTSEELTRWLEKLGQSVVVAGDRDRIKVHLHTPDPGKVLNQALKWGSLRNILVRDMDEQIKDKGQSLEEGLALVVVACGQGFIELFRSLGAKAVIPGGDKMNPSVGELLVGVSSVPAKEIILLPNNKNIVPAAERVKELCDRSLTIIPTNSLPQGVAAAVNFNPEVPLYNNLCSMERAIQGVKTISITKAVRSAKVGGFRIKKGQFIALLDGELIACEKSLSPLIHQVVKSLNLRAVDIITIYYGEGVLRDEAESIAQIFRENSPAEVEVVFGGQPLYPYLISLE